MIASRHRVRVIALLCAGIASASAFAQAPASTLADCHRIDSSADRLACYDAVSGRGGAVQKPGEATPPTAVAPDAMTQAVAKEATAQSAPSMIDAAWGFDPKSSAFDIRFHRANYLLIGRYTDRVNNAPYIPLWEASGQPPEDLNSTEAKFQISFKSRLWTTDDRRWGAWVGYTQQNQWQVYNGDVSRPFRETNYMPEAFVSYRPGVDLPGGFRWGLLNAGYVHQSNGRTDILSRSWDRVFAEFAAERGNLALYAKVWYPFNTDDNDDIADYLGYGEIGALWRWRDNTFSGSLRGNIATGKGAVQVNWFSRPIIGMFRGYVQFFSGYGESLIDYNWRQTTIGAGIALSDGL